MDPAPSTSGEDFFVGTPDMKLSTSHYERLSETIRATSQMSPLLRKHPDFDPWSLALAATSDQNATVHFRGSLDESSLQVLAWLQSSRQKAMITVASQNFPRYSQPDSEWYTGLAHSSVSPDAIRSAEAVLAEVGICLVVNHGFPVHHVDGAAFLLSDGTPTIALSLRYAREDSFWFTLFHELAHVKFDLASLNDPIVDNLDLPLQTAREVIADDFALQSFITNQEWRNLGLRFGAHDGEAKIYAAATKLSISPTVVAGRLCRELNDYTLFPKILNRTKVREYFR